MTLYLDDGDVRLHHGDALETLRQLPAGSVDMVATSPPFYGLRDYGTGTWEGGDESCDHMKEANPERRKGVTGLGGGNKTQGHSQEGYGTVCGRCGARRVDRQIGLEETPDQWVDRLVQVFRECRRVLADHGTLWIEIGDSYSQGGGPGAEGSKQRTNVGSVVAPIKKAPPGYKPKDLLGQPWMLAFALRADGWYLRSEIIWARPNPMPESVTDRPTKSHSTIFLLSKQPRYFYDADAIREAYSDKTWFKPETWPTQAAQHNPGLNTNGQGNSTLGTEASRQHGGANARSVWTIPTQPTPFAHFATWPQKLVARMIQAGTSERGKCPECGKPWVRDVERTPMVIDRSERTHEKGRTRSSGTVLEHPTSTTLGWSPSCTHDHQPVPCTVLDPFAGSGTTLLVARNHGRHAIGIELNETYCKIAAEQLQQLSLLTQPVEPPEPTRVSRGGRGTGLTGGAYNPPGQSPHSNARPSK